MRDEGNDGNVFGLFALLILPYKYLNPEHFPTRTKIGMCLPQVKPRNFSYGATLKSHREANGSHFSKITNEYIQACESCFQCTICELYVIAGLYMLQGI